MAAAPLFALAQTDAERLEKLEGAAAQSAAGNGIEAALEGAGGD